jgi:hypothetical protein
MVGQYQSERRKEFGEFMNLMKIASHLRKPLGHAQDETTQASSIANKEIHHG